MPSFQYVLKDNTVQVVGHEQEYVVLDFGDWESNRLPYYRSLLAHKKDLECARAYLEQMFFQIDTSLIDGALINAAIQLLVKCFSSSYKNGRVMLDVNKVFRTYAKENNEEDLTRQYSQFKEARNKVLSHDERDHNENIVGLVVNKTTGKAEDIAEITVRTGYLYSQNQELLLRMINIALGYIDAQIEGLKSSIIEEFNHVPEKPALVGILCKTVPMATAW